MRETRIEVRSHSGYRGEEYPESFIYHGGEHRVAEILDQVLVEDSQTGGRKRVFLVETQSGSKFELIHSVDTDVWYCLIPTTGSHR